MLRLRCAAMLAMALSPLVVKANLPAGHLDPTFGVEGKRIVGASLPGGSQRGPATLLEGPEGRLYLIGSAERADATVAVAIARLARDGDIDTDFGTAGLLEFVPEGASNAAAYSAVFDAQQRLIVVGETDLGGRHTLVCRLDANGAADPSFGQPATPGCIVQPLGVQDWANDVLVQACPEPEQCVDGTRIVVAGARVDGNSFKRGVVAAFEADGSGLDSGFGMQGVVAQPLYDPEVMHEFTSLSQNFTGAVAAAGWVVLSQGDFDFVVLRTRPGGELETAFGNVGTPGIERIAFDLGPPGSRLDVPTGVHLGDDEAVWIAGRAQLDATRFRPAVVKLDSIGEGSFEFSGAILADQGELSYDLCGTVCDARFTDMSVLADGRILLAGSVAQGDPDDTDLSPKNNTFVMRVLPDGTPDPTFRSPDSTQDGLSVIDHGEVLGNSDDVGTSMLLQGDTILVAGYARAEDTNVDDEIPDFYDFAIARVGRGELIFGDGFE